MRSRLMVVLFVVFAAISLQGHLFQETPKKEKKRETNPKVSFIRIDLLRAEKKPLPPAPRSIFTAQRSRYPDIDTARLQEEVERIEGTGGVQREQPEEYLDLRYIGYVRSGTKIVALVIFQGEALAVEEGEMIVEGITVKKIGLEEIEVMGPDSKPSMFSLEGELP
ncbi:hypothetical protein ACFLT2_00215 [Acidobacteriota bacterium]